MVLPFLLMAAAAGGQAPQAAPKTDAAGVEEETLQQLLTVRRVFVDRLTGGETAAQMRDMIVSSLQNAKLFVITENADRADAVLRGSAEDLVFTDEHSSSDSAHADARFSRGDSTSYSGRTSGRDQNTRSGGIGIGDSESSHSLERKHEAVAA